MKIIISALFAIVLFITNDSNTDETIMYICSYRGMDQMIPYPYIIQQKDNSIYLFNNQGILIDKIENQILNDKNELNFKQKHFLLLYNKANSFMAYDLLDTLNFRSFKNGVINPKNGARFDKLISSEKQDIQKVKKEIQKNIWKNRVIPDENSNPNLDLEIEQLLRFQKDSIKILTNYYYKGSKVSSEYETKAYNIFEIDNIYFISLQKESDNPQPIYQLIKFETNGIELKDFSSSKIKSIFYYKKSLDNEDFEEIIKNTSYFSNCFDGYQGEYYFGEDVTFNKGNKYILDFVNNKAPSTDKNSGYVIVHFTVNCKGKVGRFGLIQMDKEFKHVTFSKDLISHIMHKVSLLKDFPSTYSQSDYPIYKDIHAFLMFKIEKGKINDLCP